MDLHERKLDRGALYVVATPIGNLSDLSDRAKQILSSVNFVAAEDTRGSRVLLEHIGSKVNLIACHEHSEKKSLDALVRRLEAGESAALITDAGTPGISDPGAALVNLVRERGLPIYAIPGPSALTALLSISGFSGQAIHFYGFAPRGKSDRAEIFRQWKNIGGVFCFFESPKRVQGLLADLAEAFPDQQLIVGRELTKRFEEVWSGTASEVAKARRREEQWQGEFALVLQIGSDLNQNVSLDRKTAQTLLESAARSGELERKQVLAIAAELGISRNEAYRWTVKKRTLAGRD